MDEDVGASGGDPSVAALQDHYLTAESRASMARDHLAEMAETQRKQAESVVAVITGLREGLRNSEMARISLDDDNRRLSAQNADLERELRIVHANYVRLSESYSSMVNVVENTHSSSVGLHQRIDAMLLQNDLGIPRHPQATQPGRVTQFREGVFSPAQPRAHMHDPRVPQMHQEPFFPPQQHEGDFHHYGQDHYATRPAPAHRIER